MSFIGNIIWLIFGGFFAGLGYIIGGLAMCITIIGIPFGVQQIRLGFATMTPFGKKVEVDESANTGLNIILNAIWCVFFGWEIAINHLVFGILFYVTIVGIPFGQQHFKLIPMALFPFGRKLV
jgi:uncharacterized membrane protein YccF (DUF307 family)